MKHLRLLIISLLAMLFGHSCSGDEPFASSCGVLRDTTYRADADGVLRVLAIGNSFSQDAMEKYLPAIFEDMGVEVELGNARIGGCSLERHARNAKANANAYSYWHWSSDAGEATVDDGMTLDAILKSSAWDIVTIQQVSQLSGLADSYDTWVPYLISYVRDRAPYGARVMLHQTWAYDPDSDHSGFANDGNSTAAMHSAIVSATERAASEYDLDGIIPSGMAINYAREMYPDVNFTRDGYHLHLRWGRYTASATWYEALTGCDARQIEFRPKDVSASMAEALRECAHRANQNYAP